MTSVEMTQNHEDGFLIMGLVGTLDAPGAMEIEDEFQDRLSTEDRPVIVDLTDLEYISSYGLRMLLTAAQMMHQKGIGLHLAAPNDHVMKVITIAGYDTMFPVHDSLSQAVSALNS